MDKNIFLKREIQCAIITGIATVSLALWLVPKHFKVRIGWELLTGFLATSSMLTAASLASRLEVHDKLTRAEEAAQKDMFSNELAHQVYLQEVELNSFLPKPVPHQAKASPLALAPIAGPTKNLCSEPASMDNVPSLNLNELTYYPSIIIFGAQGSGKTTLARIIADHRSKLDSEHTVTVLDPHGSDWPYPVIGRGMNYDAISTRMSELLETYNHRYLLFGNGQRSFPAHTTICDEFTNFSSRIKGEIVISFLRTALTDIRKINELAIFLTHANTLEGGLAGAKGLSVLRNNGAIQIELMAQRNPQTGRAEPTGYGKISRPGEGEEWVRIPNHSERSVFLGERPEPLQNLDVQAFSPEPLNVQNPEVQPHSGWAEPSRHPFDWAELSVQQEILSAIAEGHPKADSLKKLLGVSKGAGKLYQKASRDWDSLKEIINSQAA